MILETLKENFKNIVVFDFEFTQDIDEKGERAAPLCAVYKEIKSGKYYRCMGDDLKKLPFNAKETLFVPFNAVAEASCFMSLGIKLPKYWWDVFVENKKLYLGKIPQTRGAFGLVRTAQRYQIEGMSEGLKKWNIDQILKNNPDYTPEMMLDYCQSDVDTTEKVFYAQLKDLEETFRNKGPMEIIQHALFHGRSMAVVAEVEHNGIPIDDLLYEEINKRFPILKEKMINDINSRLDIYEAGTFSNAKFKKLVKREGLLDQWPTTPSGALSLKDKVIYDFSQINDAISEYYLMKEFVDSQKLKGFIVGPDKRARTKLNMFGIKTGRTNQSTSRYPFNAAKPMRNIIKPNQNWGLIYSDYKSQEIAIAAYLSKDQKLITAYESGDPYIYAAQMAGSVPKDATKQSHPKERNLYKVVLLATLYGQGSKSLAARLNISVDEAVKIIADIKNVFSTYFEWITGIVNRAMVRGYITTKFGWRYWIGKQEKINPRTLFNFPIQAHGSEMLRHAMLGLVDKGIELSALIHDGLMIHAPLSKINDAEAKVKSIMENASRIVLDGDVCPVEMQLIKTNYKQGKEEQIKFDRIVSIIRSSNISTSSISSTQV